MARRRAAGTRRRGRKSSSYSAARRPSRSYSRATKTNTRRTGKSRRSAGRARQSAQVVKIVLEHAAPAPLNPVERAAGAGTVVQTAPRKARF